jgi:hypothetical protein
MLSTLRDEVPFAHMITIPVVFVTIYSGLILIRVGVDLTYV